MPRKKSLVWEYFQKNSDKEAECLICHCKMKVEYHCTSSLRKHLIRLHQDEARALFGEAVVKPRKKKSLLTDSESVSKGVQLSLSIADDSLLVNGEINQVLPECETKQISLSGTRRHKRKSAMWNFFTQTPGAPEVTCKFCNQVLAYSNGSTSSLKKHIGRKHSYLIRQLPDTYDSSKSAIHCDTKMKASTQGRGSAIKTQRTQITNSQKNVLDEKLIQMIALDLQPVSIIGSKGFINLMTALNPQYAIPNRKTVGSELLPNFFKQTMSTVLKRLEEVEHIALTTDMWRHEEHEIYLSVTAHFNPPSDWTLHSAMLSTTAFIGSPTGKEISCELQRVVTEWNLSHKVTVMVTDTETNTLLANEQLPWAYIPCFGHLIHLVVTDAITADEEAADLIQKVSDVVNFFHHNYEAKDSLLAMQKEKTLPEHKLISNVNSRWNSIYYMLERMNEQFEAVDSVLEMYLMTGKRLSEQDRVVMNMIISSLKPFEFASLSLSSDESSNISVAMPIVKGLVKMMSSITGAKEPLTANLKEGLVSSFGKMEEIEWIMIATLLDPRFKKFPFAEREAIEKARENIQSEVLELIELKHNVNIIDSNCADKVPSSKNSSGNNHFWNYFDVLTNSVGVKEQEPSAADRELNCYLGTDPIPRQDNPLYYWKQHEELLPSLYKVAMKYMCVPITSVSPDRLFTKAGEAYVRKISKIKPKNINMILFLNKNMQ